ncbi:hypothetical protein AHAS_Ahas14G0144100 [Arachis hypogaea]
MLLSAPTKKNDNMEPVYHLLVEQKADDNSWSLVIEALLVGSGTSSGGGLPFIGLHSLEANVDTFSNTHCITDPTFTNPVGKTAAAIATSNGHNGLAGYLSEVALTSYLSSLTLKECEIDKDTAEIEVELTINHVSKESIVFTTDGVSLADVRNAALPAARI